MRIQIKNDPEKSQEAKTKILKAAECIFAEKGYDGARVDEIAKRAKVNKALLYYYFENKEKLLHELVRESISQTVSKKEKILNEIRGFNKEETKRFSNEEVEMFFDKAFKHLEDKKDILRIITMEALKSGSEDTSIFKMLLPSLPKILKEMEGDGCKTDDSMDIMIYAFFFSIIPGAVYFTLGDKWADFYNVSKEEADKRFADVFKTTCLSYCHNLLK